MLRTRVVSCACAAADLQRILNRGKAVTEACARLLRQQVVQPVRNKRYIISVPAGSSFSVNMAVAAQADDRGSGSSADLGRGEGHAQ